jgi:predicted transcriptional regulator of viral defense system
MKKFDDKEGLTMADIAELTGSLNKKTVKYNVLEWFKTGMVDRVKRGRYRLCEGARRANSLEEVLLNPIDIPCALQRKQPVEQQPVQQQLHNYYDE